MRIVVVGASGHARVVVDAIRQQGGYEIVGFLDQARQVGEEFLGLRVLGTPGDVLELASKSKISGLVVAIGNNGARARVVAELGRVAPEVSLARVIHPRAIVGADVEVGDGSIILAGAIVNPGCRIGRCCIVNTGASLDHDSRLGDFASLAPRVATGGNYTIGSFAAVGLGALIKHGVIVGERTVIGMGAVVVNDVAADVVAYGAPAKVVRALSADEGIL